MIFELDLEGLWHQIGNGKNKLHRGPIWAEVWTYDQAPRFGKNMPEGKGLLE